MSQTIRTAAEITALLEVDKFLDHAREAAAQKVYSYSSLYEDLISNPAIQLTKKEIDGVHASLTMARAGVGEAEHILAEFRKKFL